MHVGPFVNTSENGSTETSDNSQKTTTPSSNDSSKTPVSNQPVDDNTSDNTLLASITNIEQTDSSLKIGTLIEGVVSSGSCVLTLTKDGKNVTDTVGVQALASSSTCEGFDIPIVELSPGSWKISIEITVSSKEAHLSDSVVIE